MVSSTTDNRPKHELFRLVAAIRSSRICKREFIRECNSDPCGGGFEYLHRGPASRTRRRKGKSQIWESKIWSRVPRDSDPKKTTLPSASTIYKRQTRPLVRESALEKQDLNCQRVINIWSWTPDGARHQHLLIDCPSVVMWLWIWLECNSVRDLFVTEFKRQFTSWVFSGEVFTSGQRKLKEWPIRKSDPSQSQRPRHSWSG
jgi:hypothetical protein